MIHSQFGSSTARYLQKEKEKKGGSKGGGVSLLEGLVSVGSEFPSALRKILGEVEMVNSRIAFSQFLHDFDVMDR